MTRAKADKDGSRILLHDDQDRRTSGFFGDWKCRPPNTIVCVRKRPIATSGHPILWSRMIVVSMTPRNAWGAVAPKANVTSKPGRLDLHRRRVLHRTGSSLLTCLAEN